MTLVQLKSLCTIAEEGSFSRAAERLFLSQPALSSQIKLLEEEVGQPLLDRSGTRATLTEPGELLAQRAKDAATALEDAVQEIRRFGGLERGTLSIASSDTIGEFLLLPILAEFGRQFPGVSVVVHNEDTVQIEELIMDNVAEVGLVTLPVAGPQITSRTILTYRELALCAPDGPLKRRTSITLRQLVQHRLLLLPQTTRSRTLQERDLARAGAAETTVMELGSVHLQKAFARFGLGIGIVPEYAARAEIDSGELIGIPVSGFSKRQVGVIQRKTRPLSTVARTFLDMLSA